MILLDPRHPTRFYPDARSREIMVKTIEFFESRGKRRLKEDDHERVWYSDFLDFVGRERLFSDLLTPPEHGGEDARWDTWRNCEFNEILAFYGLAYWYTWQVSILGLGPIWMSANRELREKAGRALEAGGIFAFGLSEKEHGADVYSTEMSLRESGDGSYVANGRKYYIGNANEAAMVSTFGRFPDGGDYVFFSADPKHDAYHLIQNVTASQNYVGEYELRDYPISEADILSRGQEAWDTALNTVNIGKYNLGWASIGICTHALYEAMSHAGYRRLYGMGVTDFPHVKRMLTDAYVRLVGMKLFALRAADYMRAASLEDRRYLLYNPMVKMKVTTQGEEVIDLLWDVIAAKGFEKDTYFEMAARDIRALPKLEGTVHVNIALIVKFMPNFFFNHQDYPELPRQDQAAHDAFLFAQGPARGLGKIRFHDFDRVFAESELPNVKLFREQVGVFRTLLATATPDEAQRRDTDFLLEVGQLFALVVYAQLILENVRVHSDELNDDLVDRLFDVLVRDFSKYALRLHEQELTSSRQLELCLQMIRKPITDAERNRRVFTEQVLPLKDAYRMPE